MQGRGRLQLNVLLYPTGNMPTVLLADRAISWILRNTIGFCWPKRNVNK